MKKRIPTGVVNYERLQTENYYVVDKSWMIHEFLERASAVTLITRPRRFGKTSNMSMMSDFFDITKDSHNLFENTAIKKSEYISSMNQYPVIFLSFASAKGSITNLSKVIKQQIADVYQKYAFVLKEMDDFEKPFYEAIKSSLSKPESGNLQGVEGSLLFLMKKIEQYYQKKTIIFIDEYDTPFIEAHVQGYYDIIRSSLATLLHSALKDNDHLQYAMLTGIQRVAKENIFSDLNNLKVFTVKDKEYAQYFGFTTEETKTMLAYYDLELSENVKSMYDGYNMGGIDIYNPWSIINYVDEKELRAYWVNTSSNMMIKQAMKQCDHTFKLGYETLIKKGFLETKVTMDTSFYEEISTANLWGLFVNAGYLTIEYVISMMSGFARIRVPNFEVSQEFQSLTAAYLSISETAMDTMFYHLRCSKSEEFLQAYKSLLLQVPSYHDLKDENSYHMMMLGLCAWLSTDYKILSNRENGKGRCDIILKAKNSKEPSYIFEFKYTKEVGQLKEIAKQAVNQIMEQKYDADLQGEIHYIGLAHCGKEAEMLWLDKSI